MANVLPCCFDWNANYLTSKSSALDFYWLHWLFSAAGRKNTYPTSGSFALIGIWAATGLTMRIQSLIFSVRAGEENQLV